MNSITGSSFEEHFKFPALRVLILNDMPKVRFVLCSFPRKTHLISPHFRLQIS